MSTSTRPLVLLLALGCGCSGATGEPQATGEATEASDAATGGGSSSGTTDVTPPPPGSPKVGWERSFTADPIALECTMSEAEVAATAAARLTFGDSTIYVGFEQVGDNQNPIFARYDGGVQAYCERHEQESPDGRAYGLTWDGGPTAYVVYTIVGGGSALDQKGKGGWLDRYGDGGGSSKVSFVGEVETASGTLTRGTFVIAKKMDGKTNTHRPADAPIVLASGEIEFHGDSAFQPMNPDKTIMECSDYPFFTRYVFTADLAALTCSSSTMCVAKAPCE